MGKNNRQRRAAKARDRRRDRARSGGRPDFGDMFGSGPAGFGGAGFPGGGHGGPGSPGDPTGGAPGPSGHRGTSGHRGSSGHTGQFGRSSWDQDAVSASRALRRLMGERLDRGTSWVGMADFRAHPERDQQRAIDKELAYLAECLPAGGWTPFDLHEALRRKVPAPYVALFLHVIAAGTRRHSAATVHPRWREQLAALEPPDGDPTVRDWAGASGLGWPAAVEGLIDLLVTAGSLPRVEQVLPPPGSAFAAAAAAAGGIDERVLRRVRALLAKAEATEFEEEADALTAKAQALMTQYSIERTLAEAASPTRAAPVARRIWVDSPYLVPKSLLVSAVADANHCRSVLAEQWGFVTLVGHERDLNVVELLCTSLLVQATRAMTMAGRDVARDGTSRTRSFRQSFLVAYAQRIGERLRESAGTAEAVADATHDGALLPVLVSRQRAVDDTLSEMFPELRQTSVGISNAAGWGAGRAAADLAMFDIHGALTERTATG